MSFTVREDEHLTEELEDFLEHYGVLGMKWGVTRTKAKGAEIRSARTRVKSQRAEVQAQKAKAERAKRWSSERQAASQQKKFEQMRASYLNNPDRVIAARMTRGEKVVTAILAGVTAPVWVGAVSATSARSRRIEYKQERGQYPKPKII